MCAHLMRLWLGMGYRAAWCFRDVSRDAKGLGTSSKLRCYVDLRIVTLSKNLIKYENRYSQIFNIGYRELHATYMIFFLPESDLSVTAGLHPRSLKSAPQKLARSVSPSVPASFFFFFFFFFLLCTSGKKINVATLNTLVLFYSSKNKSTTI